MSAALAHWGRGLIALALFGLLVELLLPSRSTEGYVRLVVGLVLLTAVVAPVLGVVRGVLHDGLATLPGTAARSLPAVLASTASSNAADRQAVATVFADEVAGRAAAAARAVAGVDQATARADVGRTADAYGQLLAVRVEIRLTRAGARSAADVAGRARAAVAASLGIRPSAVAVHVIRTPGGPAP